MYRSLRIAILSLGGALLGINAGCEQHQSVTSPGALPRHLANGAIPRINRTTMFAHAHLLERRGAYERAVVQYQKVLAEQPQFLTARNRLGITLNKLAQHALASEQFRICIEQDSTLAHLHNNLSFSLYLQGKYAQAEQAAARAIGLNPEFNRARMNHAVVLSKLGRHLDAFEELKSIGSEADACFNMGILLTESGRYADAAQYLEAALAADPRFEDARTQLHEVARLAAEDQARNIARLASQETGAAQSRIATVGGIEDVQLIDPSPAPSDPAANIETAPIQSPAPASTTTAADKSLTVEEVWGTSTATISENETSTAPIQQIQANEATPLVRDSYLAPSNPTLAPTPAPLVRDSHLAPSNPTPAPTPAPLVRDSYLAPSNPTPAPTPAPLVRDSYLAPSTTTIEDVVIDEIEPEVQTPIQQDTSPLVRDSHLAPSAPTRAPTPAMTIEDVAIDHIVHQEPIAAAQPDPTTDVSVETIVVADIVPVVSPPATEPTPEIVAAEPETPAIEIAPEPIEIEQTATTEIASETQTDDTYVIIETIDLDAQIRETAQVATPAPIEADTPATDIEIPVTTVAHITEMPITQPTEPTAAPIEVATPSDNVVIIETIEEVSIDPTPVVIPVTETEVEAKTETAVETPLRQDPTEPMPVVIIEDVPIDPITETEESSS